MEAKKRNCFIDGAITSDFIGSSIAKHQSKTGIGAHSIFLGQVRRDEVGGKFVSAIEYTAYEDMANKEIARIREDAFSRFDLSCMHIYHSLGTVEIGEVCLFIFTSSAHREPAQRATEYLVERIKKEVPIFGKEIFEDQSYQWKVNRSHESSEGTPAQNP